MAKVDAPPLLRPGMHSLTFSELEHIAVTALPESPRRVELFTKLTAWADAVRLAGITGTLWVDGSFLTEKENPGDIDCILWNPRWVDPSLDTPSTRQLLEKLLDQAHAEALYNLDFYMESPAAHEVFHREAYWRGILGFCHDRVTAKGFAEIAL